MPAVRLVALLPFLVPSTAAAQAWLDAYNTRNYAQAAPLLHEIVTDGDLALAAPDPLPLRALALMYAHGLGVPRDPIAACALARDAEEASHMGAPSQAATRDDFDRYQAFLEEARTFVSRTCGSLSSEDHATAWRSRGPCYGFNMPERVETIGGLEVRIGRAGISIGDAPGEAADVFMCPALVARLRVVTIDPPEDAAQGVHPRHFVELVAWRAGSAPRPARPHYLACWQIHEVSAQGIAGGAEECVAESAGWPGALLPAVLDTLTMEMVRSGHVRWRMGGAPPRRGWMMLPDARAPR